MRLSLFALLDHLFAPAPDRRRVERLLPLPFAHRGLHGCGRIENSLSAFQAAIARGHGIELDVQATGDRQMVVFHDYQLERLTEASGAVAQHSLADLRAIPLRNSSEFIPALDEVLELIGERVPLLIEVKSPGRRIGPICRAILRTLRTYGGPVGVMSFNPQVSRWFKQNAPEVARGLVLTEAGRRWRGPVERRLALWRAQPDFLAYDVRDLPSRFAARARARGIPILTWTCRGDEQVEHALRHADQIIYEDSA